MCFVYLSLHCAFTILWISLKEGMTYTSSKDQNIFLFLFSHIICSVELDNIKIKWQFLFLNWRFSNLFSFSKKFRLTSVLNFNECNCMASYRYATVVYFRWETVKFSEPRNHNFTNSQSYQKLWLHILKRNESKGIKIKHHRIIPFSLLLARSFHIYVI